METVICDITAFDYWRIPPIVHLLLTGEGDDPVLRDLATVEEIEALRIEVLSALPLCKRFFGYSGREGVLGEYSKALLAVAPLIGVAHDDPVDVLVGSPDECHSSALIRPRMNSRELPVGSKTQVYEDVYVTRPAATLMQLAGRASLVRTVLLASELCGSFAVYEAPAPIRKLLQTIQKRRKKGIPTIDGWRPFVNADGTLGNLWSRPPLVTPKELRDYAQECSGQRGCARLRQAADLVKPGAASPFEAQTGVLLGFSYRRGGEGFGSFRFNKKVRLTRDARLLAQRNHCYCDLYWDKGLDLECQSTLVHQNQKSFLSDSDRTAALRSMGIDVLPVTFDQINDETRFDALAETVAKMLGQERKAKTELQAKAAKALREEVLVDWESIQVV